MTDRIEIKRSADIPTFGWVLTNLIFGIMVVYGFVYDVSIFSVIFYIWTGALAFIYFLADLIINSQGLPESTVKIIQQKGVLSTAPRSLDIAYDVLVFSVLLLSESYTAFVFYAAFILGQHFIIDTTWSKYHEE